jgi:hypothetical protein
MIACIVEKEAVGLVFEAEKEKRLQGLIYELRA